MATTNLPERKETEDVMCPSCRSAKLLFIEGSLTRWATCPSCRFRKLMAKTDRRTVRVTPLLRSEF